MSLTNEKRERIKKYLLEQIYYNRDDIVKTSAQNWNVSSTTINRYLKKMVEEGIIEKNEAKKTGYSLKEIMRKSFHYYPMTEKLEEDRIYLADIEPLIKDLPSNVKKIWSYAFSEIMNNAIEHSCADDIGVMVFTNALFTHIFISDNGIGIFEKIREYILETENIEISLDDAMSILFVGKMTTNKESHSGEGIFFTSRSLDKFIIYSSNRIFTHDAYDKNLSANINELKTAVAGVNKLLDIKGTSVLMELWNDSKREVQEVFDMFSSDEKGFYKTQVPIKSVIPSGFPVSRSQARRICSGFGKFKEIELDFANVDDVGQAFIHEIFVVFKNGHPDIEIRSKNANENVNKMIKRVLNTTL